MIKKVLFVSLSAIFIFSPINAFGDKTLHQAAYDGNIEVVRKILRNKVDPDKRDSFGGTALHAAMFQKNMEIVTLLIHHGFDVNAQGLANGFTPLHDAVWANNLEAVRILVEHGARTDIKAKDGVTPYEKAKREGKKEIISAMESKTSSQKNYDHKAKTLYSENDVKAFVYNWFAGFDHQADVGVFKRHLNPEKVDMYFPDFPIKTIGDFERWYKNVIDTIQWNAHKISNLEVSGDEMGGYSVSLNINWKAKTYKGETYDVNVHQEWLVKVDKSRNFVIEKHKARVLDK
jgi:uncharacterized protein